MSETNLCNLKEGKAGTSGQVKSKLVKKIEKQIPKRPSMALSIILGFIIVISGGDYLFYDSGGDLWVYLIMIILFIWSVKNYKKKSKLYLLVLAHIPTLYFDALTWFVLLKKKSISFFWSLIITWIAQTSGKFFPTGNVTGEFVRIYLGIKKGLSPHEASSTVFADLILATFSLFIIGLFSFFLVIFKDSSFDDIDIKRIFPDYYSWVVETLKIVKDSKETWILRKHPSADRWGENQKKIINDIFNDVFDGKKP